jgi:hypothetical protein
LGRGDRQGDGHPDRLGLRDRVAAAHGGEKGRTAVAPTSETGKREAYLRKRLRVPRSCSAFSARTVMPPAM